MVITATVQPELGQMVYARSEFPHPFQFCFYREGMEHAVQTELAWSGFGQTHLVWKQACVKELSGSVSGRTQPACYHFPIFTLCSVLSHTCRIIFSKTSPGPILFSLIVSDFGQTDPVRKQANVQESSGPLLANASQLIWTKCYRIWHSDLPVVLLQFEESIGSVWTTFATEEKYSTNSQNIHNWWT